MQIKITKEQKKILYISAVVLLFFVCFWSFIYRPQGSKFLETKKELAATEKQISEILSLTKGEELSEAVKKLKVSFDKTSGEFSQGEEGLIRNLSDQANRLKIKVKNINTAVSRSLDVQVAGRKLEELSISMNLSAEYRQLGEYLDILRNNLPILVKVTQVDIKGAGEGVPELSIELKLLAYLFKEN